MESATSIRSFIANIDTIETGEPSVLSSALKVCMKILAEAFPTSNIAVSLIGLELRFNPDRLLAALPMLSVLNSLITWACACQDYAAKEFAKYLQLRDSQSCLKNLNQIVGPFGMLALMAFAWLLTVVRLVRFRSLQHTQFQHRNFLVRGVACARQLSGAQVNGSLLRAQPKSQPLLGPGWPIRRFQMLVLHMQRCITVSIAL